MIGTSGIQSSTAAGSETRIELEAAPPVTFEPCSSYRLDFGSRCDLCSCGWPEDDHPGIEPATVAVVRTLRARRRSVPERKAS
jgi:hypothetical protein